MDLLDNNGLAAPAPLLVSEAVIRTPRYARMRAWYRAVLGVAPFFEYSAPANEEHAAVAMTCFMRLHFDERGTEIVTLFDAPDQARLLSVGRDSAAMHEVRLRDASLAQLCERYRRLMAAGIRPYRAATRSGSVHFYYRDPDDNLVDIATGESAPRAVFGDAGNPGGEWHGDAARGRDIDADRLAGLYPDGGHA